MDTVFLLLIAGVAAAILFYSAASYGKTLDVQSSALLLDYYARQAVRVISTATIRRPGCDTPDYLLAYLKEKAYYGGLADADTLRTIEDVLGKAMRPLRSAYDYAVAISLGSSDDSDVFLFVWRHDSNQGYKLMSACYDTKYPSYRDWLAGFKSSVYSYSVPIRFKIQRGGSDYYVVGRLQIVIWPAGAYMPSVGNNAC